MVHYIFLFWFICGFAQAGVRYADAVYGFNGLGSLGRFAQVGRLLSVGVMTVWVIYVCIRRTIFFQSKWASNFLPHIADL